MLYDQICPHVIQQRPHPIKIEVDRFTLPDPHILNIRLFEKQRADRLKTRGIKPRSVPQMMALNERLRFAARDVEKEYTAPQRLNGREGVNNVAQIAGMLK
jgi:hypothetical protein